MVLWFLWSLTYLEADAYLRANKKGYNPALSQRINRSRSASLLYYQLVVEAQYSHLAVTIVHHGRETQIFYSLPTL